MSNISVSPWRSVTPSALGSFEKYLASKVVTCWALMWAEMAAKDNKRNNFSLIETKITIYIRIFEV